MTPTGLGSLGADGDITGTSCLLSSNSNSLVGVASIDGDGFTSVDEAAGFAVAVNAATGGSGVTEPGSAGAGITGVGTLDIGTNT
jgi:hypothetical protein